MPGVVILDVSDVRNAVLVLEEYRYRGERRWWTHNLDRFIASARDFAAKNPHWKEWLESLERSQIDLRAAADAEALEAWLSRYRQTFAGVPSNLLSRTGHIWRDWMSVRARK